MLDLCSLVVEVRQIRRIEPQQEEQQPAFSSHLVHPHVDHHHVGQREAEEGALPLKSLLVLLFPAIGPLHVQHERSLAACLAAPDSLHRGSREARDDKYQKVNDKASAQARGISHAESAHLDVCICPEAVQARTPRQIPGPSGCCPQPEERSGVADKVGIWGQKAGGER